MKADELLRNIPVIVISALDDETTNVVRAIDLGAEDFLPRNFDPVLLRARLGASLARKRFRDQELEYLGRVGRLTSAAETLETGHFNPDTLGIDDLAERDDPLGHLAGVFRGMAGEIYQRELRLRNAVTMLQSCLLVLAVGVVWGLSPSLARMAAGWGAAPLGLAVWVNAVAAVLCLGFAAWRGKLTRLATGDFLFHVFWALLVGVLMRLTTYLLTEHIQAATLSLIVTLQGFMVFAFAAVTGLEKATPRRMAGLALGLAGVLLVIVTQFRVSGDAGNIWVFVAILLPLMLAIEGLALADKRPHHMDMFASVGIMTAMSTVMLLPMAWWTGDLMALGAGTARLDGVVLVMGIMAAGVLILALMLIDKAGAVFYSQTAYTMTIAGVVWGMLLLHEELSPLSWVAFAVIGLGMYLVEPKSNTDELVIRRSFRGSPDQPPGRGAREGAP